MRFLASGDINSETTAISSHDNENDNRKNRKKVHTVTWKTPDNDDDIVFNAYDGELLRTAALSRGLASPHNQRANLVNCRGLGTCGTCAVKLTAAEDWRLPPLNTAESLRLAVPPGHSADNAQRLRLACQVAVHGNVQVEKFNGFWGQYDVLVHPSPPTRPLGRVEFVLDRTSPSEEEDE